MTGALAGGALASIASVRSTLWASFIIAATGCLLILVLARHGGENTKAQLKSVGR